MAVTVRKKYDENNNITSAAIIYKNRATTITPRDFKEILRKARSQNNYNLWDTTNSESIAWWVGNLLCKAQIPYGASTPSERMTLSEVVDDFLNVFWDEVGEEITLKYWNR